MRGNNWGIEPVRKTNALEASKEIKKLMRSAGIKLSPIQLWLIDFKFKHITKEYPAK